MGEPYIGEIRMFAGNFAPAGWAFCAGQLMPISENDTLFTLIGTTYGGDGQETFGLPDLQGRVPVHQGQGFLPGQMGGTESVTLTVNQIPQHNHAVLATNDTATTTAPANQLLAASTGATVSPYGTDQPQSAIQPQSVSMAGNSQPHDNVQPFQCINYIISLFGTFPQQT